MNSAERGRGGDVIKVPLATRRLSGDSESPTPATAFLFHLQFSIRQSSTSEAKLATSNRPRSLFVMSGLPLKNTLVSRMAISEIVCYILTQCYERFRFDSMLVVLNIVTFRLLKITWSKLYNACVMVLTALYVLIAVLMALNDRFSDW